GKRDEKLILPVNSSLSVTLDQDQLRAKTTVALSSSFSADQMWLNGVEQPMNSERLQNVLKEIRQQRRKQKADNETHSNIYDYHVHICSENNFPTAAGLASSAAGFACLVFSLSQLYGIEGDISRIARQGSGSACRSVCGGFVAWDMGTLTDGSDSMAREIASHTHWPELRVLILVVSGKKKHTGSSEGMQNSVKTSELLPYRAKHIIPKRMEMITTAILDKDFKTFAEETIKESNQMHAVCLDTYPPICYQTDTSHDIMRIIHAINKYYGEMKVCYTFDAGPNACLYLPESNVAMALSVIRHFFPPLDNEDGFLHGIPVEIEKPEENLINSIPAEVSPGAVKYVISTKVGQGPQVLDKSESLLDNEGLPKQDTHK
ncbi:hypothetical protein LSH36_1457g00007, partial [Paralvinella palmiformis]